MSKTKGSLPSDAVKFAKKLGIELDGLEPEAAEIWKQLERLSEDPLEYERFISQQMLLAKEEEGTRGKNSSGERSFRPEGALFDHYSSSLLAYGLMFIMLCPNSWFCISCDN
jgi:hypothetical protein